MFCLEMHKYKGIESEIATSRTNAWLAEEQAASHLSSELTACIPKTFIENEILVANEQRISTMTGVEDILNDFLLHIEEALRQWLIDGIFEDSFRITPPGLIEVGPTWMGDLGPSVSVGWGLKKGQEDENVRMRQLTTDTHSER